MKKISKTYGVYNLMEWQCDIGGHTINFTGGSFTGYGVRPAQYTTKELFLQTLIERSRFFLSGRIKLLKSRPTDEDIIVQRAPKKVTETAATETVETVDAEVPAKTAVLVVSDRDDAVTKLNAQYGVAKRRLNSRAAILAEAAAAGVTLQGWPND